MSDIEERRESWRTKAREVAKNVVAPRATEIDAEGEFAWDLAEVYSKYGFLSLLIPKEYGGMDTDVTSFCLVAEEIANVCASSSLLVIVQAVGTMPVVLGGTSGLKERVLPRLAKEKGLICFCLTEPESGSDAASVRTKAVLQGDRYVINGRKCFITNGGVADFYTVFATTNPDKRIEGITGFVVEKGTPGLSVGKTEEKMGIRGSNTTEVILEDVKVPVAQRLGDEGAGWWLMMRTLNRSRPAIGAQAVGLAQGALDYVIQFAKGKGLGEGKRDCLGVQLRLADMAVEVEAARALVYKAAEMMDEKVKGIPVQMFSAMSKYFASDVAMKVTTEAVQILQWQGLTQKHPLERMMRDAKVIQIFEGTNQIQRMVVAHTLLKSK
ncbi:MAG TPA: acyl-CoA dehydrogenase family protein [Thermodesulfobacteriota bacterium]|jgi:alkylation response protein AidB-like acyl-CoA dehydrogenase|nr:acyl-CoA dehydrogenase family protein [Thermodesulfobacteriota bacterium]